LIFLLDADDQIHPQALKTLYLFLKFNNASLACPGIKKFGAVKVKSWKEPIKTNKLLFYNLLHSGVLISKEAWEKTSGYNKNMLYGLEEWDIGLSFIENNLKIINVAKPLYYYRRSGKGMANTLRNDEEHRRKMLIQIIKNHPKLYSTYKIEDLIRRFRYREVNEDLFRKELKEIEFIKN
jgi:hypothetical protein